MEVNNNGINKIGYFPMIFGISITFCIVMWLLSVI